RSLNESTTSCLLPAAVANDAWPCAKEQCATRDLVQSNNLRVPLHESMPLLVCRAAAGALRFSRIHMSKKGCVVTGSSSGIGAASAILFAQRGWDVCVNYSKDPKPAEKVAAICKTHGAGVLIERADVSDDAQCVQVAKRVKEHFGRCDALVNNAGTTKFVDLKDLDGL